MYFNNSFFSLFNVYLRKIERKIRGLISLRPKSKTKGVILLSYVTHPFAITKEELLKSPHTNPWECLEIAGILLERGYAVDVIDWTNKLFTPKKKYKAIIDVMENLGRLAPYLQKECVKIFYITGAYWAYQNKAEQERLEELKKRRGISLKPERQVKSSNNIEYADYVSSLGNNFAKETYAFAKKPITSIPLLTTALFQTPENKNFKKIAKNFVWIGGGGAVHKGLDLVLEYFAIMPDYHLTVCGPVGVEKDFYDFYKKELLETPNIEFVGRVDVRGEKFKKIIDNSVGLIYPSCSEGQAGSVTVAVHAGLIPIATYQSGVDVESFGIKLEKVSTEEIKRAVELISSLSEKELRSRAIAAWKFANENFTRETFRKSYETFIDGIFKERNL
mgnify:CR=1 FL=1